MLQFNNRGKNARGRSHSDVTITIRKDDAIGITLRNGVTEKITTVNAIPRYNLEYAVDGNRLYFRGTISKSGFRCFKNAKMKSNSTTCYVEIDKKYQTEGLIDYALQFEGDHDLQYDENVNLYFIESGMRFHGKAN